MSAAKPAISRRTCRQSAAPQHLAFPFCCTRLSSLLDNQFCLLACLLNLSIFCTIIFPKVDQNPICILMILFWAMFQWLLLRWANPSGYLFCTYQNKQGVCHTVALPFTLKVMLRQKEELWKLKYFIMQKYNLQKNPLKEKKILQDIITL